MLCQTLENLILQCNDGQRMSAEAQHSLRFLHISFLWRLQPPVPPPPPPYPLLVAQKTRLLLLPLLPLPPSLCCQAAWRQGKQWRRRGQPLCTHDRELSTGLMAWGAGHKGAVQQSALPTARCTCNGVAQPVDVGEEPPSCCHADKQPQHRLISPDEARHTGRRTISSARAGKQNSAGYPEAGCKCVPAARRHDCHPGNLRAKGTRCGPGCMSLDGPPSP
jgi:hypothetical protein